MSVKWRCFDADVVCLSISGLVTGDFARMALRITFSVSRGVSGSASHLLDRIIIESHESRLEIRLFVHFHV